jgi:hypothetical protein
MINRLLLALVGALAHAPAQAQYSGHGPPPYAGLKQRPIKALSAVEIADLRNGRGWVWRSPPSSTVIPAHCM